MNWGVKMIKNHQRMPTSDVKWVMYKKIMETHENSDDLCFLLSSKHGCIETMSIVENKARIPVHVLNVAIEIHALHYNLTEIQCLKFYIKILIIKYFNIKKHNIKQYIKNICFFKKNNRE